MLLSPIYSDFTSELGCIMCLIGFTCLRICVPNLICSLRCDMFLLGILNTVLVFNKFFFQWRKAWCIIQAANLKFHFSLKNLSAYLAFALLSSSTNSNPYRAIRTFHMSFMQFSVVGVFYFCFHFDFVHFSFMHIYWLFYTYKFFVCVFFVR